ncbi:hypothetical protein F4859DRAFT_528958 [Xylaria cf. heliscus]|nr:hypothetical protein F4859DRAFT_528958 [Xylaria cf. heliscus]
MFQSILTTLLFLFASLPAILAGNLIVHNQCQFTMWCGSAANDGSFTPAVQVYAGGYYTSPQPAVPGEKGVVVKCGLESNILEPYQLEVAQDADTRTWLDLSDLNGRPFQAYRRYAEIAGTAQQVKPPVNGPTRSTATPPKTW